MHTAHKTMTPLTILMSVFVFAVSTWYVFAVSKATMEVFNKNVSQATVCK